MCVWGGCSCPICKAKPHTTTQNSNFTFMLLVSNHFYANLLRTTAETFGTGFQRTRHTAPTGWLQHFRRTLMVEVAISTESKRDFVTHGAFCRRPEVMDRPNSSSSGAEFYWKECAIGPEDNAGLIQYSAGIVTVFVTSTIEIILGIPFNIWLICHILNKRFDFTF